MTKKRQITSGSDVGRATAIEFNEYSGAKKTVPSGAVLIIKGLINVPINIDPGTICYLFNNSATVAFVATSTTGAIPTGITDGIALKPYDWTVIAVPEDHYKIAASTATVGLYIMKDDSRLA